MMVEDHATASTPFSRSPRNAWVGSSKRVGVGSRGLLVRPGRLRGRISASARIHGAPEDTVGKESGSRWRSRIGPREGVPGGRAPAVKVEGAQCPVDKESLNRCAGGEACAHQ